RRNPMIFPPTDFLVKNFSAQLSFYIFQKDKDDEHGLVAVLTNAPQKPDKKQNTGPASGIGNLTMMRGGGGAMGAGGMAFGGAGGGMMGRTGGRGRLGGPGGGAGGSGAYGMGSMGPGGAAKTDDKVVTFKKVEDLKQNEPLAESNFPVRAAMVVGAFPLKKQ